MECLFLLHREPGPSLQRPRSPGGRARDQDLVHEKRGPEGAPVRGDACRLQVARWTN